MRASLGVVLILSACSDFESLSRGHDAGLQLPAHCTSGTKDGDESDTDCGGSCLACDVNRMCALPADCETRTCTSNVCVTTSAPPGWLDVTTVPTQRVFAGLGRGSDGRMYVIGGSVAGTFGNKVVEAYDVDADAWQAVAPLNQTRQDPRVASGPDGRLYAIGGGDEMSSYLASVEAYDPAGNTWTLVASLETPRQNYGATSDDKGHIYVLGGYWGTTEQGGFGTPIYKTDIEIYDGSGAWIAKPVPVTSQGEYFGVGSRDGLVYQVGGTPSGDTPENAVRVYDPAADAWSMTTPTLEARADPFLVTGSDDRLYGFGGDGGQTAEAFDGTSWATVAAPLGYAADFATGPDGRIFGLTEAVSPQVLIAYGPVLQLATHAGAAGSSITVAGQNFATRATVSFSWDTDKATVASAESDDLGAIEGVVVTAPAIAGTHRLVAIDARSRSRERALRRAVSLGAVTRSFTPEGARH